MDAAVKRRMRSLILAEPRRVKIPVILDGGERHILTLRESTIADDIFVMAESERRGKSDKPAEMVICAFARRIDDDPAKAGLMAALDVHDDNGLEMALLNAPGSAMFAISDAMEALAPPDGGEASKPSKKTSRKMRVIWTIIALLFGVICIWIGTKLDVSQCANFSLL